MTFAQFLQEEFGHLIEYGHHLGFPNGATLGDFFGYVFVGIGMLYHQAGMVSFFGLLALGLGCRKEVVFSCHRPDYLVGMNK
jgi:hypothetical protein